MVDKLRCCRDSETYQDDLEQHFLVDLHELLIPLINVGGLLARVGVVIGGRRGIGAVLDTPLDDFAEDWFVDIRDGNGFCHDAISKILHHVLDQDRSLSDIAVCRKLVMSFTHEGHFQRGN